MQFEDMVNLLTTKTNEAKVVIKGKPRTIKGMVKLTTVNYPDNPHIKITFTDGSFLLLMLADQEAYFAEVMVDHIKSITDEEIGNEQKLIYQGREYTLENKDDYQYVIQRYAGSFHDVEGEARFSDYFPTTGPKEFLSLGWLTFNGERADINPILTGLDQIQVK